MKSLAILPALFLPIAASAVVATTSKTQIDPSTLGWSGVGQMGGASAVAIGPHLVLTAAHVAATDFLLGGIAYHMTSTEYAPKVKKSAVDLRLVTVAETLPTWYALASSVKKGATITMVGFGGAGVVNAAGDGYAVKSGGKHKGTNTIVSQEITSGQGPTIRAALKKAGDAVLAGGDSGGGWFMDGQLVGISDFVYTTSKKAKLYAFSKNGDFGSGAVDVTNGTIRAWLAGGVTGKSTGLTANADVAFADRPATVQLVPEPASFATLGLGIVGLARLRRKVPARLLRSVA